MCSNLLIDEKGSRTGEYIYSGRSALPPCPGKNLPTAVVASCAGLAPGVAATQSWSACPELRVLCRSWCNSQTTAEPRHAGGTPVGSEFPVQHLGDHSESVQALQIRVRLRWTDRRDTVRAIYRRAPAAYRSCCSGRAKPLGPRQYVLAGTDQGFCFPFCGQHDDNFPVS